ncbi:MAG: hypothetical protein Kow0031_27670 [Anaerolineae bacterium]
MSANLQKLVGKILEDETFVDALAANPKKALEDAGIEPTLDLLDALEGVDPNQIKQMAATFGKDQAAL